MSDIVVLHYQDARSNKIWAIEKTLNQEGGYTVWWGRKGTALTQKTVPGKPDCAKRMMEKLDKGYVEVPDMTIDMETNQLIPRLEAQEPDDLIPTSLWYRIGKMVSRSQVNDFLIATRNNLAEVDTVEAQRLESLSVYQDLLNSEFSSGAELKEGPLGVLLLFSLRRYFKGLEKDWVASPSLVQIADDNNQMLPDDFEDLEDFVRESCESYFVANGWMKPGDTSKHGEIHLVSIGVREGLDQYTSLKAIKTLAMAMGCFEQPIDLSVIETEQKAAFF